MFVTYTNLYNVSMLHYLKWFPYLQLLPGTLHIWNILMVLAFLTTVVSNYTCICYSFRTYFKLRFTRIFLPVLDFKSLNILGSVSGSINSTASFPALSLISDKPPIQSKVSTTCTNVPVSGGRGILTMECKGEFPTPSFKLMHVWSSVMRWSICKFSAIHKYNGIVYS